MEEFTTLLYNVIVEYCIPRPKREEAERRWLATREMRHWQALVDQARNLFVSAPNSIDTTGEPGELILFLLLEGILFAPQIACKMYLKTSENVPVHGADGIHVRDVPDTDELEFFWGESKLFASINAGINDALESIQHFIDETHDRSPRNREIEILRDHISLPDGPLRDKLLRYFDPWEPEANTRRETFAMFVGYNSNAFSKCANSATEDFEAHFRRCYATQVQQACTHFVAQVHRRGLNHLRFYVFFIPFESVTLLRRQFLRRLRSV